MIRQEVLDAMLAAGCSAEQIVAAVKADTAAQEAAEEEKRAAKREKTAERVRNYRARNATKRVTQGCNTLQKEVPPDPLKKNTKNPPTGVKKGELRYSEQFERFRQAYPKRDGGQDWPKASEAFERFVRDGVDPEDIIRAAGIYAEDCRRRGKEGSEFVKQAVSFVRGRLWPEWLERSAPQTATAPRPTGWPSSIPDPDRARTAFLRGLWPGAWGFEPGHPSCAVPHEIQQRWLAEKAAQRSAA